ncbi:MAG: hypothetical protein MJ094_03470 [Saccharofermentans sp.]|nr:hypothetical protein [Saccharofermentans sp.]
MNRLDRFRFGNLHKRRIFGVISIFVLIAVVAVSLLAILGFFGSRAELPRINLSANPTSGNIQGVGFNILDIPDSNVIEDPFFDSRDNCLFATITEAEGNYIYFDSSEGISFGDVSASSEVNVLSIDADGVMGLRFSSYVSGYDSNRFGIPIIIHDSSNIWSQDSIAKIAEASGVVYALTESGVLVQDITSKTSIVDSDVSFVDICSSGNFVYAVATNGDVYIASEGGNFTYIFNCCGEDMVIPTFISSVNGSIVVFMDDGTVRMMSGDSSYITSVMDASYVQSSFNHVVVVDCDNKVYVSSNALFYNQREDVSSLIPEFDSVIDLQMIDSTVFILTNYGTLICFDINTDNSIACDISSIEPVGICPVSSGRAIAVASDYQAFAVDVDDGSTDSLGTGNIVVEDVFRYDDNQFIINSGNSLYETSLMSALLVENPIGSSIIESGDICMVKTSSVNTDTWDVQGDSHLIGREEGVSLTGNGDGLHVMSRRLEYMTPDLFEDGVFYRIDLALSTTGGDLDVYAWLEGESFGQQGMQVNVVDSNTEVYSFVFAVTDNMIDDEYLRLNIAYEGYGILNVDYVYVGPSNSDVNTIPSDFRNCIVHNNPSALRFQSMIIGSSGFCDEAFYGIHPDSAESAMLMSRDAGANPWFVMGSQITQHDVDNFLGYMCGSVSSEYGKRRIDNGTALPWSRQFDSIFIEICDSEDAYLSDVQRGAYVDYVKGLFERSSFYIEIKDRIIFVDGMNYDGGVVLSSADRHASSMNVNTPITVDNTFIDCVSSAIDAARFNAPRAVGGEYISSLSFNNYEGSYTAADVVASIIQAQSSFAELVMLDSDTEVFNSIETLRFLVAREQMFYEVLDPVDSSSEFTSDGLIDACDFMLVDGDTSIYLIVANHSDIAQQFITQSSVFDIRNASYIRYSSSGELLVQRDINRFRIRQYLQPGEYMIVNIPK